MTTIHCTDLFSFLIGKKNPKEAISGLLFPHTPTLLYEYDGGGEHLAEYSDYFILFHLRPPMRLFYRMDNFLSPSKGFRHPSQILRVISLKGEFSIFNFQFGCSYYGVFFIRIFFATAIHNSHPSRAQHLSLSSFRQFPLAWPVPFFGIAKFQNIKVYCKRARVLGRD